MFNNTMQLPEMAKKPKPKAQDLTKAAYFRLRKSDLDAFDEWCKKRNVNRTEALEMLIRALPQ